MSKTTNRELKKITIKLTRGRAAASKKQAKILDSLGLRRTNSSVEHFDSNTILGMLNKVNHLVTVS
jgi:large subunit ribosomal protein L30